MKLWCAVLLGVVSILVVGVASADDLPEIGRRIAAQKCAGCHAFTETKRDWSDIAALGGPDLFFAGSKFKKEWLAKWLVGPTKIRPAGFLPFRYVTSTPAGDVVDLRALPAHLAVSSEELPAILEYLMSLKKDVNPYPISPPEAAIRPEVHFQKILPCGACHRAGEVGGGISGPDLTRAAERIDRDWLFSFISDPEYWTKDLMPKVSLRSDQLSAIGEYLLGAAAGDTNKTMSPPPPLPPGAAPPVGSSPTNRAEMLYRMFCSQCHGIRGNGKGINAPFMFVKPRDHTSSAEMSALTDDRLLAAIKFGGAAVNKSTLMPSWGATLKDSDIQLLVEYLRTLSGAKTSE